MADTTDEDIKRFRRISEEVIHRPLSHEEAEALFKPVLPELPVRPYVRFRNLNGDSEEEITPKPAVEIGLRFSF